MPSSINSAFKSMNVLCAAREQLPTRGHCKREKIGEYFSFDWCCPSQIHSSALWGSNFDNLANYMSVRTRGSRVMLIEIHGAFLEWHCFMRARTAWELFTEIHFHIHSWNVSRQAANIPERIIIMYRSKATRLVLSSSGDGPQLSDHPQCD